MNSIEEVLGRSKAYRQVEPNGDDYPVYGGGGPYTGPASKTTPAVYNRSITNQGTFNRSNEEKAKKFDEMEQAKFIQNVEESSRANGQFEGAAQMKQQMEELLYRKQVEEMKRDVGPNDISDLRLGDAAADAQGAPRSNTPWSTAVRQVAGDMEQANTIQQNTDRLNNAEGYLGSPDSRDAIRERLEGSADQQ